MNVVVDARPPRADRHVHRWVGIRNTGERVCVTCDVYEPPWPGGKRPAPRVPRARIGAQMTDGPYYDPYYDVYTMYDEWERGENA